MSLKTLKRKGIHDYDSIMNGVKRKIQIELSAENVELISQYDMEMVRQSIAIATRQKHLKTLLSLSRLLKKNWKDVEKNNIEQLVYEIMQRHGDESGKETNYSYDHKKILKIFFRWLKLGSREFAEVGDPPETKHVKMRKVRDKIIREDLLTESDRTRLLHACGENQRDRAFIDCHFEGGTRPGEILTLQIKHVKFDKNGAMLHVDGKTGPRTVRLVKSTPTLASWLSIHPMKDNPEAPLWIMVNKISFGQRMSYVAASSMIRRRAKSAHLTKRVHLNIFRHSEATDSARPNKALCAIGFYSFTALIDMKVKPGARYIHSASEPYNEEQELSQERIDAWINHFGMHKFQSHCSGHARGRDLIDAVSEIGAKMLFPVHTVHPDAYRKVTDNLTLIEESKKYEL